VKGIGVSSGIALGRVIVKKQFEFELEQRKIENVQAEMDRVKESLDTAKDQIQKIIDLARENMGEDKAMIFSGHQMILSDPEFVGMINYRIENKMQCAEWALTDVTNHYVELFENMENEYFKERVADIKDISNRIMKVLTGNIEEDLSISDTPYIIVAHDLAPSDTAQIDKKQVIGFVTEIGGRTSHTAIMARTLEIPAVVGVSDLMDTLKSGDVLAFDGDEGFIHINPTDLMVEEMQKRKAALVEKKKILEGQKGKKTQTKDHIHFELAANIGTPDDIEGVINNDAEGIGLYRTEFLFMNRNELPDEKEQFEAYKKVLEGMNGKPVVIRTLDIGGDKNLSYLDFGEEMNPFLGYRAIRLCLDRTDIFEVQLRALLRASVYGNLKIMFPMISNMDELRQAKAILSKVEDELKIQGINISDNIEVGMMIEVPSAAILSDQFAQEVDFFSIGTNDLTQYTCAVDRMNQRLSSLYSAYHPAVLRLVKMVIDNASKHDIWVGMCGEAAGDPNLVPLLIGMGIDELSMSAVSILSVRHQISQLEKSTLESLVNTALNLRTAEEVEEFLTNYRN